jgi:hypothetical protein
VRRRVTRHVAALEAPEPVLVIRRARETSEVPLILDALRDFRDGAPFLLLALGYEDEYGRNWGMQDLHTARMPPDDPSAEEAWRGHEEDWDRLLAGCEVVGD